MKLFDKNAVRAIVYWITERDHIRAKKEAGLPKPWTKDPILRDHRWCNVCRMDDRVSRWLMKNWYQRMDLRHNNVAVMATLARMINWPDALTLLLDGEGRFMWGYRTALHALRTSKRAGNKVFTGAYIINGAAGGDKIKQVLDTVRRIHLSPVELVDASSMRRTWEALQDFRGIGSFIAGQITADLRYVVPGAWNDRYEWAPIGPGSRRGMRRMLGMPAPGSMKQEQFNELLPQLWDKLMGYREVSEIYDNRHCEAMDLQNCLCEFDKYMRLTYHEGSVRSKYNGMPDDRQGRLF